MSASPTPAPQGPQVILPPADFGSFLGHPTPLYTLFFAELWERFSCYGMRALLTLYMVAPLAMGGVN